MTGTRAGHHRRWVPPHRGREDGPAWQFAAAGLCASLVGLGLARFAYTPLIPALIAAKWFSPPDAVYLGAANLAGYLAGAGRRQWRRDHGSRGVDDPAAYRSGQAWRGRRRDLCRRRPRCRRIRYARSTAAAAGIEAAL